MDLVINKRVLKQEGEGLEAEAVVLYEVGSADATLPEVLSLRDSVKSGAVSFFQPTSILSRAMRGINRAFHGLAELLSPLRSVEGSELLTLENPKGDTEPRYVEISVPGARPFMCPIVNPPVEMLSEITALWSAIVDDDLVRIYYVPKSSMGEITAQFSARVLK